jgi:hypothetical protein
MRLGTLLLIIVIVLLVLFFLRGRRGRLYQPRRLPGVGTASPSRGVLGRHAGTWHGGRDSPGGFFRRRGVVGVVGWR